MGRSHREFRSDGISARYRSPDLLIEFHPGANQKGSSPAFSLVSVDSGLLSLVAGRSMASGFR